MEEIYEPTTSFNFDQIILSPPISILGGNHFIKYSILGNPLYIQSPKCTTKQGIIKAGKKLYCDLMMSSEQGNFIQWLENLENYSQEHIFKNRAKWFETDLEKHDIENSFSSPVKTYKSGKFYITRTNVPNHLGKCSLKIYDEHENVVDIDQIKDTTNIITILEVQGIKCSPRSFQIEIELKQMMVLKPSKLFEKCIIKTQNTDLVKSDINTLPDLEKYSNNKTLEQSISSVSPGLEDNLEPKQFDDDEDDTIFKTPGSVRPNRFIVDELTVNQPTVNQQLVSQPTVSQPTVSQQSVDQKNEIKDTHFQEMTEIDFHLEELPENETIQIKNRNEVYYQMYREAKKKAKLARDLALSTYLDAKRIKNTYMLDEIDDESDLDENPDSYENDPDEIVQVK
jgi:hypothetical protein